MSLIVPIRIPTGLGNPLSQIKPLKRENQSMVPTDFGKSSENHRLLWVPIFGEGDTMCYIVTSQGWVQYPFINNFHPTEFPMWPPKKKTWFPLWPFPPAAHLVDPSCPCVHSYPASGWYYKSSRGQISHESTMSCSLFVPIQRVRTWHLKYFKSWQVDLL